MKRIVFLQLFLVVGISTFAQSEDNEIIRIQKKRELATYEIHVYPNPSSDRVFIHAPEGATCEVYSSTGTYVGTWEIQGEGISLEDLGSGSYIAMVRSEGETVRRKFVIL